MISFSFKGLIDLSLLGATSNNLSPHLSDDCPVYVIYIQTAFGLQEKNSRNDSHLMSFYFSCSFDGTLLYADANNLILILHAKHLTVSQWFYNQLHNWKLVSIVTRSL